MNRKSLGVGFMSGFLAFVLLPLLPAVFSYAGIAVWALVLWRAEP